MPCIITTKAARTQQGSKAEEDDEDEEHIKDMAMMIPHVRVDHSPPITSHADHSGTCQQRTTPAQPQLIHVHSYCIKQLNSLVIFLE